MCKTRTRMYNLFCIIVVAPTAKRTVLETIVNSLLLNQWYQMLLTFVEKFLVDNFQFITKHNLITLKAKDRSSMESELCCFLLNASSFHISLLI